MHDLISPEHEFGLTWWGGVEACPSQAPNVALKWWTNQARAVPHNNLAKLQRLLLALFLQDGQVAGLQGRELTKWARRLNAEVWREGKGLVDGLAC